MAASQIQTGPRNLVHKGFTHSIVILSQPILNFDEQVKREIEQAVPFSTPTQPMIPIWVLILLACCVFVGVIVAFLHRKYGLWSTGHE